MSNPSPSILRQLIENVTPPSAEKSPVPPEPVKPEGPSPETAQPAASTKTEPVAAPVVSEVAAQPVTSTAAPATAPLREAAPRAMMGLSSHLRILADNAPVAMAIFDTDMRYLYANHRWIEVFRLERIEITGRTQYEIFPSLHPGWRHVYERALSGQIVRSDRDTVNQAGRPVLYRWEVRPWRHVDASVGGVMITCLCIAGVRSRDVAENAAAPAAGDSATSLWSMPLPLLALDEQGRIQRAGVNAASLFLPAGLQEGHTFFWQLFGEHADHGEVRDDTLAAVESVLSGASSSATVKVSRAAQLADGPVPGWWHITRFPRSASGLAGDGVLAIGFSAPSGAEVAPAVPAEFKPESLMVDDSLAANEEIAGLQAALNEARNFIEIGRAREARLRSVLDAAPCGLLVIDEHGQPVFHNDRAAALLGRPMHAGQKVEDWLADCCRDEQHRAEVVRQWRESVWRRQLARVVSVTAADGLLKDIELSPATLPGGGMLVMLHDVTNERRAEEVLRATEAKFRTLVHENPTPVVLTDRAGAVFEVNSAAESALGYTRPELRRMTLDQWMSAESLAARGRALRDLVQHGELSANVPVEVLHRDGGTIPADLRLAIVPDSQGQAAATVQFIQPVLAGSPAPAAAEPGSFLQELAEPSPRLASGVTLLATDYHGRISEWSDEAEQFFGLPAERAIGRGLHTLFRPSDATGFYSDVAGIVGAAEPQPVEWDFIHAENGRSEGRFVVIPGEADSLSIQLTTPPTLLEESAPEPAAAREPEAPAAAVAKPSSAELERERLILGETHHRVKNHLQIITSMLNLQLSTIQHEDAREALRSSQNRVRSIAALHQHLYALAVGEVGTFLEFVNGLIGHLRDCYEVPESRVSLVVQIPETPVPEEWLMPLALSLNEMVSNAFKHGYPGGREGAMKVELNWNGDGGDLIVQDDGVGVPGDFENYPGAGLGLKILRVFAGQLGGQIHVSSEADRGSVFHMHFAPTAPAPENQD